MENQGIVVVGVAVVVVVVVVGRTVVVVVVVVVEVGTVVVVVVAGMAAVVVVVVVVVGIVVVVVVVGSVVVDAEMVVVVVAVGIVIVVVVVGGVVVVVGELGVGEISSRASPCPLLFLKCTTTVCFPALSLGVAQTSMVGLVPHFSRIWRPSTHIRIESSLFVVNRVTPAAKVNSAVHDALKLVNVVMAGGVELALYRSSKIGSQTVDTGEPVNDVLLKNCTSHSPGLHETMAATAAGSGTGDGIGALAGPLAKAGVNARAARADPLFGR